jgi:hypothetical protein
LSLGASIAVFGSTNGIADATLAFKLDGEEQYTFQNSKTGMLGVVYQSELWRSPTLEEGNHTLLITQIVASTNASVFLDYITYTVSDVTSNAEMILFDDRDAAMKYSSGWSQDDTDGLLMRTASYTTTLGSSFDFEFNGTSTRTSNFGLLIIWEFRYWYQCVWCYRRIQRGHGTS